MIEFQAISKTFQRRAVLDDISLSLGRGNRVALVGSNGAGKTTLIRCLLGEYVCQGKVRVDGIDPRQDRRGVLARIGFVPQLPPPLKIPVGELINFSASVCNTDPKRMEHVAEQLGLDMDVIRRQPFVKLSGGQKQKLLIGIALGRDSDILVMDEPAANLDPESRKIFFNLLSERLDGTVMLMSSHRIDEVAALVNRVIELDRGKVVLDDHVEDTVDPSALQACTLRLVRAEEALSKSLTSWGFVATGDGLAWTGTVAGPDRLRFLAMMSRYAGLIAALELK
ncbi:ABC transporter ATP-binding protein [Magnetovibrio sp.]|uniref:ABC transporter ATP-binding protein n=1 Tax=Magnetovibrio sp. TaxID=2024836 RepID=UPI002F920E89